VKRFILCAIIACTALMPLAANGSPSPDEDDKYYSLRQYVVTVESRENLIAVLRIIPAEGWKWNEKYPVKLDILKPPNGTRPYKLVEQYVEQLNKIKPAEVAVWLDLKPSLAAKVNQQHFTVEASYSLCNKTTCRVFKRDIKF